MNNLFTIQNILDRGKGAVAARAISAGQLILEEAPLLIQQYEVTAESLADALSCLPRDDQIRYLSLSNAWPSSTQNPLVGIWLTNAIPCGTPEDPQGDETETEGVFLTAARFNASCRPNVHHWWDHVAQRLAFRANRNIDPGEELCIAYVDILRPRADRRETLETYYNFLCCCEACSLREEELRDSDHRRGQIARIRTLEALDHLDDPSAGLRKIKLALQLLDEEGLLAFDGAAMYIKGFDLCAMAGDAVHARAWAKKVCGALSTVQGPDCPAVHYWANIADYPQLSHVFGIGIEKCKLTGPEM